MLHHIHIRDFAIVEALSLDLHAGLTVLTGETGAGKSVLLEALGLALGDRADSALIRHGAERAEISVTFGVEEAPAAREWLRAQALEADGEAIVRRVISREGASRAFLNGRPVPVQALRELGEMLVDLHGQHEHQSLLRRDVQRQLLDAYAELEADLAQLGAAFDAWQALKADFEQLQSAREQRDARLELLRYQVGELEALRLQPDELAELEQEHARLANASRLLETGQAVLSRLYDAEEAAAAALLERSARELGELLAYDARLAPAAELIDGAVIQAREAAGELRHYLDRLELEPERLAWVEQRLDQIHDLARKHRVQPQELPALLERLSAELAEVEAVEVRLGSLGQEIEAARAGYLRQAERIGEARRKAGATLARAVTESLQGLGMPGGCFDVAFEPLPEDRPSALGLERVEFLVSANPGQPLKPLAKVASGGELSRISLAIQVETVRGTHIPTLVFDEVDVGIGGRVAEIVGRQLRALAERGQVICVTHLPQVAALGHHHLRVEKQTAAGTTQTGIRPLSPEERVEELARMLGGIEITEQTRSHAREMIDRAAPPKRNGRRKKAG